MLTLNPLKRKHSHHGTTNLAQTRFKTILKKIGPNTKMLSKDEF